jgi:hypothetical protein
LLFSLSSHPAPPPYSVLSDSLPPNPSFGYFISLLLPPRFYLPPSQSIIRLLHPSASSLLGLF